MLVALAVLFVESFLFITSLRLLLAPFFFSFCYLGIQDSLMAMAVRCRMSAEAAVVEDVRGELPAHADCVCTALSFLLDLEYSFPPMFL